MLLMSLLCTDMRCETLHVLQSTMQMQPEQHENMATKWMQYGCTVAEAKSNPSAVRYGYGGGERGGNEAGVVQRRAART
jgi:hypothetical protein